MVLDLSAHGIGKNRFGAGAVEDFVNYAKGTAGQIAGDRGVKSRVVAEAIRSVTGIAPMIDTRDPKVTWVRTVPGHSKWLEAVFTKSVLTDPSKKPADMKIDVMPALSPLLAMKLFPAMLLAGGVALGLGYMLGRSRP